MQKGGRHRSCHPAPKHRSVSSNRGTNCRYSHYEFKWSFIISSFLFSFSLFERLEGPVVADMADFQNGGV